MRGSKGDFFLMEVLIRSFNNMLRLNNSMKVMILKLMVLKIKVSYLWGVIKNFINYFNKIF